MPDEEWPERYRDGNGYLKLTQEVRAAIGVRPVDEAEGPWDPRFQHEHKVIHWPTGISQEYRTSEWARGMNPNDLADAARRQLVRENPEILDFHDSGITEAEENHA